MTAILILGIAISVIANLWLVVVAFRTSFLWGVASLLVPMNIVFVVMHWQEARRPFFTFLIGMATWTVAAMSGGAAYSLDSVLNGPK